MTRFGVVTGEPAGMYVIGGRFRALAGARAALAAIRAAVPVAAGDMAMRPLGSTEYEAPAEEFLVAGRFDASQADTVIRIMHAHGGRIVERRLDSPRWSPTELVTATPPRAATSPRASTPLAARLSTRGEAARRKRLRRPAPPLRVRAARGHRVER